MRVLEKLKTSIRSFSIALINAFGVILISRILPGVELTGIVNALLTVFLISYLNSKIMPVFNRFALPVTVYTLGIGGLVVNGLIVIFVSNILPGLRINNLTEAIIFIFGIAFVNTVTSVLFAFDDDTTYFQNVIKRQAKRHRSKEKFNTAGVIFLQIDGLGYEVLKRAIQNGNVPNITRWLREGKYRLERWETDWSSQTGASQAGILMGNNDNIPAFRWYEKKLGKTLAFGRPGDLRFLEKKLSNGKGLLFHNGASRGNLFSGDAEYALLTVSSIGKKDSLGIGHSYYAYFSNPYNLPRTIILFIFDLVKEMKSQIEQERRNVWPRLTHRKLIYPFLRASMTVVQRDIIFQTLIGDAFEGRDTVYADIVGYDEVSHHTGPERYETLAILRDIDRQIGRLEKALKEAPRKYHLVLLSDHGQTQGATFKQISGYGLDELISRIIGGEVSSEMVNTEDQNVLNTAVLEITKSGGLVGRSLKSVTKTKSKNNINGKKKISEKNNVKVLASGALGLIYFTKFKHRLKLEEIDKYSPGLIDQLAAHPLIGFILVDSKKAGGIVIGPEGEYYLKTDKVKGKNPLANFGPNAARHVKRTNNFYNVADIMINSKYDPVMNEVNAFEELLGSHGALGGEQIYPFVLFPSEWHYPDEHIIGASNLHKIMKTWLNKLGQPVK